MQHYPGKAKINVNIPNTTSPELKSSSPAPTSLASIPTSAAATKKSPTSNGDTTVADKKKVHPEPVSISIRVKRALTGNLGPYLNPRKVADLEDQFGPGPIHQVVRKSVQRLVDVSLDQKAVFGMLRQGEGRVIITASFEDEIQRVRLPAMENETSVIDFLEILFEELRCEPFYQVFKKDFQDPEDEPLKNGLLKRKSNDVTLTFSHSAAAPTATASPNAAASSVLPPTLTASVDPAGPSTPKIPRLSSIDPASFYNGNKHHKSTGQKPRGRPLGSKNVIPPKPKAKSPKHHAAPPASPGPYHNKVSPASGLVSPTKSNKSGPIYQNAHKLHLAQEKAKALAATMASRTLPSAAAVAAPPPEATPPPILEPEQLPKDPTMWTIDNVISHLSHLDSALRPHVEMFRSHEIDGNALLLLTSDMMMKYMGMKLGPALKICNIINMIQGKKHQPIPN